MPSTSQFTFFSQFLLDYYGTLRLSVRDGGSRCRRPACTLNRVCEVFGCLLDIVCCLEGGVQGETLIENISEVIPICVFGTEAWLGIMVTGLGCKSYQYWRVVRGKIKTELCCGKTRRKSFCYTKLYKVRYFNRVRGPMGRLTRGEVGEMVLFQSF
jgi:hypothetical protein